MATELACKSKRKAQCFQGNGSFARTPQLLVKGESNLSLLNHQLVLKGIKIIYNAKGSNRTWEWLAMVSVSIFALRDVMRKVHKEFVTPFNSTAHTSPSTVADIQVLRDYLEAHNIQSHTPAREHNDCATEARDLLDAGAAYANTPAAFRNFTHKRFKTVNKGFRSENSEVVALDESDDEEDSDEMTSSIDAGSDLQLNLDDLLLDDDEFPADIATRYVNMIHEVIGEFESSH